MTKKAQTPAIDTRQPSFEIDSNGDYLTVRLPIQRDLPLSSTGKSRTVASTGGFARPALTINGKAIRVNVNAIIDPA